MKEMSEQESLASLVGGGQDREPVVTGDLLEAGLRSSLGSPSMQSVSEAMAKAEMQAMRDDDKQSSQIRKLSEIGKGKKREDSDDDRSANGQHQLNEVGKKILQTLCSVRENLIDAFGSCKLNSSIAGTLTSEINKIGSCIINMGGDADAFDPLNHVSGLEMPDVSKNAQEVIERTIQCYKLGGISDARVLNGGKEIDITFEGEEGNTRYVANGRIVASSWTGNEAIDYVYTPLSGKMSVKAFEGGRWVSKNDENEYRISWELDEIDMDEDKDSKEVEKDVEEISQNNMDTYTLDGEDDIGSPIESTTPRLKI